MTDIAATTFRTKTGTCSLDGGRILLNRSGGRGAVAKAAVGPSVNRVLVLYSLLAAALLGLSAYELSIGDYVVGVFNLAVALFLIRLVWRSRGLSAASDISFASVTSIESHAPVPPLTRAYFVVHFKDGEKALRRMIILPGLAEGGSAEYTKATEAFRQADLPFADR